jgi:hypothetical protein
MQLLVTGSVLDVKNRRHLPVYRQEQRAAIALLEHSHFISPSLPSPPLPPLVTRNPSQPPRQGRSVLQMRWRTGECQRQKANFDVVLTALAEEQLSSQQIVSGFDNRIRCPLKGPGTISCQCRDRSLQLTRGNTTYSQRNKSWNHPEDTCHTFHLIEMSSSSFVLPSQVFFLDWLPAHYKFGFSHIVQSRIH